MRSASVTPGRHPRPGSSSISVPKVTAGTAVCRHVAAILVLPIRRPAWQKAASCQVCFAAGVTCFCLGTQSLAKNSSGSRHTAPRTPATCGVAIASARIAYQRHLAKFTGPEWERLRKLGARPQRPLCVRCHEKVPVHQCATHAYAGTHAGRIHDADSPSAVDQAGHRAGRFVRSPAARCRAGRLVAGWTAVKRT
jgi:hypothetical protein